MSYKDYLDPRSGLFHQAFQSRKHTKSQLNGQTKMSQTDIILRSNAKAHHW
ncbi:YpzG family protein [Neobacillus piezotolerans]|uniref:YpzG family protein n=2 Tax=Neobacillus TaxID=2675232 RepID=A0A3D8GWS0_9BACI|nr:MULTISPECIES: YpzG family protein [Bacillaceae]RDU38832.1 YpzG family protein [Neobacillus piezotolerans]RHW38088.1 YpzG family protein [Neobacillus notoginsengisoli]